MSGAVEQQRDPTQLYLAAVERFSQAIAQVASHLTPLQAYELQQATADLIEHVAALSYRQSSEVCARLLTRVEALELLHLDALP